MLLIISSQQSRIQEGRALLFSGQEFSDADTVFEHEVDMTSIHPLPVQPPPEPAYNFNLPSALLYCNTAQLQENACVSFEPGSCELHLILPSSPITTVREDYCPCSSCHAQPAFPG